MNISLTPHFEALVKSKVESSLYNSVSEVMREALSLMEERDQLRELRLEQLKRDIQQGINSGLLRNQYQVERVMSRCLKRPEAENDLEEIW
ncbi:MAG: type II toxin-antitoxin system ParD family antitoxin [Methylobacter sp.]|nr:type II toxin-antitoxin system ParD family antitoxin [Methylobacter sp.]